MSDFFELGGLALSKVFLELLFPIFIEVEVAVMYFGETVGFAEEHGTLALEAEDTRPFVALATEGLFARLLFQRHARLSASLAHLGLDVLANRFLRGFVVAIE